MLKIRHLERRKIQGTYFKISALYFKIYGLYFLQQAMCVFPCREIAFATCTNVPKLNGNFARFSACMPAREYFCTENEDFEKNIYAIEKYFHYICGIIKRKKKTRFTNSHITWKQTKGEGTEIPSRKSSALTFAKEKLKEMSGFSAIWCTKKNCVLQFHNPQKHLIAKIFIAKRSFR